MPGKEALHSEMQYLDELSTLPVVVMKLLQIFDNPNLSLSDIAAFVSRDPALTARLLQVVNSPFFGFKGRIGSIAQALLLLGLNQAKGLLLGMRVSGLMREMEGLWAHSIGTAIVAQITARKKGLREDGELFVTGLLHDIGKVFMYLNFPDEYRYAIELAYDRRTLILDPEQKLFQSTHAEVAGSVLEGWHLPRHFVEPIRYHHKPSLAKGWPKETALIHFSDILTRARGFGSGGDSLVPAVDETAWARLNMSRAEIKAILWESEPFMHEARSFLADG
jgi:putative nucleotidyltransferase with HDIG domain